MYLRKFLIPTSFLLSAATGLGANELSKNVYMEFQIPPMVQFDRLEGDTSAKDLGYDTEEISNFINCEVSSNVPWQIKAHLDEELSNDVVIKLFNPIKNGWKRLSKYKPVILASGKRSVKDKKLSIKSLTRHIKKLEKKPAVIILTISTATPKEVIEAHGVKKNEKN